MSKRKPQFQRRKKKPEFGQLPPGSIPELDLFLVGGAFKWAEAYVDPIESPR